MKWKLDSGEKFRGMSRTFFLSLFASWVIMCASCLLTLADDTDSKCALPTDQKSKGTILPSRPVVPNCNFECLAYLDFSKKPKQVCAVIRNTHAKNELEIEWPNAQIENVQIDPNHCEKSTFGTRRAVKEGDSWVEVGHLANQRVREDVKYYKATEGEDEKDETSGLESEMEKTFAGSRYVTLLFKADVESRTAIGSGGAVTVFIRSTLRLSVPNFRFQSLNAALIFDAKTREYLMKQYQSQYFKDSKILPREKLAIIVPIPEKNPSQSVLLMASRWVPAPAFGVKVSENPIPVGVKFCNDPAELTRQTDRMEILRYDLSGIVNTYILLER